MKLRVIIYARVSTEDQVEKYGLPLQLRACRDYAAAHGYEVAEEIAEEMSGAILERKGLDRVRELARAKAADVVLMFDVDRLSRELAHLLILKPEIERNARLEFVNASFENSPSGRMFFGVRGVIAQYERELTRDRTMRGKRERAKAGKRIGGREPYGYRDQDGALVVDEERAAIARQMFAWYDSGLNLRQITMRLRESGAPTWGGGRWGHSSVRAVLRNEVYAGVSYWGPERIVIPVPALVAREQWERVQLRLGENFRPGRPTSAYLLRGVLWCHCGLKMYGESGTRGKAYRCRGRDKLKIAEERRCFEAVNSDRLDRAVWGVIQSRLTDAGYLRAMLREHEAELRASDPDRLGKLEAQAKKLRRREEAALSLLLDPDLANERAAIKRQLHECQMDRRRIEGEIASSRRVASIRSGNWIEDLCALLREDLASLGAAEEKQAFVRGLVGRAVWTGEALEMRCFLGPQLANSSTRFDPFSDRAEILLIARLAA